MRKRRLLAEQITTAWYTMDERKGLYRQTMILIDDFLESSVYRMETYLKIQPLAEKVNFLFQ
jgi:hypothetical protein